MPTPMAGMRGVLTGLMRGGGIATFQARRCFISCRARLKTNTRKPAILINFSIKVSPVIQSLLNQVRDQMDSWAGAYYREMEEYSYNISYTIVCITTILKLSISAWWLSIFSYHIHPYRETLGFQEVAAHHKSDGWVCSKRAEVCGLCLWWMITFLLERAIFGTLFYTVVKDGVLSCRLQSY